MNLEEYRKLQKQSPKQRKHDEDDLQEAVVKFVSLKYPNIVMYSIPNGGGRKAFEVVRLKRQGLKNGIPDLCIAKPFRSPQGLIQFGALYLELKAPKGRLSDSQKLIIPKLQEAGNRVEIVNSLDQAMKIIDEYLK